MSFREILNLVWINLLENKFKVILTSLGIIVGSATIVIVIAIGQGGQQDVQEQFKNLNAGTVTISDNSSASSGGGMFGGMMGGMPPGGVGGSSRSGGGGFPGGMPGMMGGQMRIERTTFTNDDLDELSLFVPNLAKLCLMAQGDGDVDGGTLDEELTTTIVGATPSYQEITNLTLLSGSFFDDTAVDSTEKVAVLGYDAAIDIFENVYDAYDSVITINGKKFTVIGVLAETGSTVSDITLDGAVYIPLTTAEKYVLGSSGYSPEIVAMVEDINEIEATIANMEQLLTEMYPKGSFEITDAGSQVAASQESANTLSVLLIAVASIVFIVGGIGIMNVLFVSVKERTREIGILKALGSSKRDILLQFLLEANLISVFGGVLGVAASCAIIPLVRYTGMTVLPSTTGALLALVFAIVTGTLFGFYPAWQAASLKPIEALNQD